MRISTSLKKLFLIYCLCSTSSLFGQVTSFILEQQQTDKGDSVRVCLMVDQFEQVVSMQFSLSWDPDIIEFAGLDNFGLAGLDEGNFATQLAGGGQLPFVWFDPSAEGLSLADSSLVFCLYFIAIGEIGDSSLVEIGNEPTPIEIGILDSTQVIEDSLGIVSGKVEIVESVLQVEDTIVNNICFGDTIGAIGIFVSGGEMPYTYEWTGPNSFTASTASINSVESGDYQLSIKDNLGRESIQNYIVGGPSSPLGFTNINIEQVTCGQMDGSISLEGTGGTAPYLYDIGDGFDALANFESLAAGDYMIALEDANGCLTDTLLNLTNQGSISIDLGPDPTICPGDSTLLAADPNFANYNWFFNDVPLTESSANITVNQAGNYRLEAIDEDNCPLIGEVNVLAAPLESGIIGPQEIFRGDSVILFAGAGSGYNWSPGQGLSCISCQTPIAFPEQSTSYFLQFTTEEGCLVADSVLVEVALREGENFITPITFLSPNGDGSNDELFFPGLDNYLSNELKILSRWGQIIYSKVDYQINGSLWDGTLRGKPLPAGVYYYILNIDEPKITIKRTLTIVRD